MSAVLDWLEWFCVIVLQLHWRPRNRTVCARCLSSSGLSALLELLFTLSSSDFWLMLYLPFSLLLFLYHSFFVRAVFGLETWTPALPVISWCYMQEEFGWLVSEICLNATLVLICVMWGFINMSNSSWRKRNMAWKIIIVQFEKRLCF